MGCAGDKSQIQPILEVEWVIGLQKVYEDLAMQDRGDLEPLDGQMSTEVPFEGLDTADE